MITSKPRIALIFLAGILCCQLLSTSLVAQYQTVSGKLNYDKAIELAQKLAIEGKYDVARLICHRVIRDVPDYADAFMIIGNTYAWEEKRDSARIFYQKVFEFDNGNVDAFNQLVNMDLWEGNGYSALELVNAGLAMNPSNPELLYKKARAHVMLGQLYDAKKALFILLDQDPGHREAAELYRTIALGVPQDIQVTDRIVQTMVPVDTLFKRAQNYAWNQEFTSARQLINSIIDTRADYTPAIVLLAQTYAWENDYSTARGIIQTLDLRSHINKNALLTAIDIELWSEDYDAALYLIDQYGLRYLPKDQDLLFKKADVYMAQGDTYLAKDLVWQQLMLNPGNALAIQYYNELKAEAAKIRKNYRFASQAESIEEGMDAQQWLAKARDLAGQKQYSEAQSICMRVLDVFPEDYEALFLLGNIQSWMGNFGNARKIYEALLAKYFDSYELIVALIELSLWESNYTSAIEMADYGLQVFPNDKDILLKKSTAYQRMGEEETANNILNRLLAIYPDDPDIKLYSSGYMDLIQLNAVSGEYTINTYDLPTNRTWHMYSARYYRSNDLGTLVGGLNYGLISSDTSALSQRSGVQFEIDAYPVFKAQRRYFHLRYGFSPSAVFARHRMGAYVYQEIMPGWELAGGLMYNYYKNDFDTTHVFIAQAGLNKYWSGFMAGFMVSLAPTPIRISQGYTLVARKFFGRPDNWLQLSLNAGVYPENPALYQNDITLTPQGTLNSYTLMGSGRYVLTDRWIGTALLGYQLQEYQTTQMRNNWIFNASLIYLIGETR